MLAYCSTVDRSPGLDHRGPVEDGVAGEGELNRHAGKPLRIGKGLNRENIHVLIDTQL